MFQGALPCGIWLHFSVKIEVRGEVKRQMYTQLRFRTRPCVSNAPLWWWKNNLVLLPPAVKTLAVIAWLTAHLSFPCLLVFSALTTLHLSQLLAHSNFQHTESNYAFFLIWTAFKRNKGLSYFPHWSKKKKNSNKHFFFSFYKSRRIALYRSAWLRQNKCSLKNQY